LHFSHKNEILISIKEDLEKVLNNNQEESIQMVKKIIGSIQNDLTLDDNWNQFELHFDEVHENFLKRFKETYPDLKPLYLKLCAYIRMN
jgi:archaellum component FlaC